MIRLCRTRLSWSRTTPSLRLTSTTTTSSSSLHSHPLPSSPSSSSSSSPPPPPPPSNFRARASPLLTLLFGAGIGATAYGLCVARNRKQILAYNLPSLPATSSIHHEPYGLPRLGPTSAAASKPNTRETFPSQPSTSQSTPYIRTRTPPLTPASQQSLHSFDHPSSHSLWT